MNLTRDYISGSFDAYSEVLNYLQTLDSKLVEKKTIFHAVMEMRPNKPSFWSLNLTDMKIGIDYLIETKSDQLFIAGKLYRSKDSKIYFRDSSDSWTIPMEHIKRFMEIK